MPGAGRHGLAMVVGRRSGHGLALVTGLQNLLAKRRILAAAQPLNGVLGTAEPLLHRLGLFAASNSGSVPGR